MPSLSPSPHLQCANAPMSLGLMISAWVPSVNAAMGMCTACLPRVALAMDPHVSPPCCTDVSGVAVSIHLPVFGIVLCLSVSHASVPLLLPGGVVLLQPSGQVCACDQVLSCACLLLRSLQCFLFAFCVKIPHVGWPPPVRFWWRLCWVLRLTLALGWIANHNSVFVMPMVSAPQQVRVSAV